MLCTHARRRYFAVILALLLFLPANAAIAAPGPEHMQLLRQLAAQLESIGLSFGPGVRLIQEGVARAIPGTAAEAAALEHGSRELVRWGIQNSTVFLKSVVTVLGWAIERGTITAQTANRLGHSYIWKAAGRRAGAASLGGLLQGIAVAIVAKLSYEEGLEYTRIFLAEMEQFATAAEADAYTNLLKSLMEATTRPGGNLALCGGMSYAEAATRLEINMRTSPTKPFWNILCRKTATDPQQSTAMKCQAYARDAVAANQKNLSDKCGFGGPRWQSNYDPHYNWCMAQGGNDLPQKETRDRTRDLDDCARRRNECAAYAQKATQQNQQNLAMVCGYGGPRWLSDYNAHYNWCFNGRIGIAVLNRENAGRESELTGCREGKSKKRPCNAKTYNPYGCN